MYTYNIYMYYIISIVLLRLAIIAKAKDAPRGTFRRLLPAAANPPSHVDPPRGHVDPPRGHVDLPRGHVNPPRASSGGGGARSAPRTPSIMII